MNEGLFVEHRRHQRFRGTDGALAAFSMPGNQAFVKLGEIIDINEKGLSVCYVSSSEQANIPPHLDIFGYKGPHIHISAIPCKVIYENELLPIDDSAAARRCGVVFGDLTSTQKFQLEQFIESYTLPDSLL